MIKELNDNFVKVHQLPVSSKNFFSYPSIGRKINKYIQANNINLVHVRSRGPAWMINLMSKNNVKTIATFHNVYGGKSFFKKMYNKGLSKMDHLIAISDYVRETVIQKYNITNKNISVINRGIDIEYFNEPINNDDKEDFISRHADLGISCNPIEIEFWRQTLSSYMRRRIQRVGIFSGAMPILRIQDCVQFLLQAI